jgi:hypothetical protein
LPVDAELSRPCACSRCSSTTLKASLLNAPYKNVNDAVDSDDRGGVTVRPHCASNRKRP